MRCGPGRYTTVHGDDAIVFAEVETSQGRRLVGMTKNSHCKWEPTQWNIFGQYWDDGKTKSPKDLAERASLFSPGDLVQLKCGGPAMLVDEVDYESFPIGYTVVYFHDGVQRTWIQERLLNAVDQ